MIRSCQTPASCERASKKTKVGFEHQLAACCVPVARIRELGAGNRNVNVTRHKKSRHAAMDMDGGLQLKASQRHTGAGRSTPATTTLTMGTLEASKPKRKQHAHPRHALAVARRGVPDSGRAAMWRRRRGMCRLGFGSDFPVPIGGGPWPETTPITLLVALPNYHPTDPSPIAEPATNELIPGGGGRPWLLRSNWCQLINRQGTWGD